MNNYTEVEVIEEIETVEDEGSKLVVLNDNHNTFDNVIEALVNVCSHTPEQAEQCAHIVHYKGKCSVREGSYDDLLPYRVAITDRGINAIID